ncbi:hypothetical protein BC832DRAFT_594861 [Gaertneriomyces semiglobifer]|nr:hypothetical protein BC832DRAFT_594861 [Gaertneriomyces semiglobifer]
MEAQDSGIFVPRSHLSPWQIEFSLFDPDTTPSVSELQVMKALKEGHLRTLVVQAIAERTDIEMQLRTGYDVVFGTRGADCTTFREHRITPTSLLFRQHNRKSFDFDQTAELAKLLMAELQRYVGHRIGCQISRELDMWSDEDEKSENKRKLESTDVESISSTKKR